MKRTILASFFACILFACNKEKTTSPDPTTASRQPVQFSIANFISEQENLRSANGRVSTDSSLGKISNVYYFVFNSFGGKLNYIHQDSTFYKTNFGVISDSLAPGTYTVVLVASEKPLSVEGLEGSTIFGHTISPKVTSNIVSPVGDVFFKKMQVVITATENLNTVNVSLDRIVGQIRLELLDALPASIVNGGINVEIFPVPTHYRLWDNTVTSPNGMWQYFGTRTGQTTFVDHLMGTDYELKVYINYKDKVTGANRQKIVERVKCQANKRTIIRGNLYEPANSANGGLQIKVNQAWNSDSTIINFN